MAENDKNPLKSISNILSKIPSLTSPPSTLIVIAQLAVDIQISGEIDLQKILNRMQFQQDSNRMENRDK
jgi:hypothetical protein